MYMHRTVIVMRAEKNTALFYIRNDVNPIQTIDRKNRPAQSANFRIEITLSSFMDKKIKLQNGSIDISIHIHNQRFGAASIHGAYHMKNPARTIAINRIHAFNDQEISLRMNVLH